MKPIGQNSELRNLFIKPYSPIYIIDLDIHIVHIVIHNFEMCQGDIRSDKIFVAITDATLCLVYSTVWTRVQCERVLGAISYYFCGSGHVIPKYVFQPLHSVTLYFLEL